MSVNSLRVDEQQIEHYRLMQQVGRGGMGRVFKAHDTRLDRVVAIKILNIDLLSNAESHQRFLQEARILSQLVHPNIVSFYSFGVWRESPYFVMEYFSGQNLNEYFRAHPTDFATKRKILVEVCQTLQHAHNQGIVHRDLKPSNILISTERQIKLIDFGLAAILEARSGHGQRLTQEGSVVGTPNYLSPEQCMARPADSRSDIYSLGCIAYEAFYGTVPFAGRNAAEVMQKHLRDEPSFLCANPGSLPVEQPSLELQRIIAKAMKKEPEQRFNTTSELATELRLAESCINSKSLCHHPNAVTNSPNITHSTSAAQRVCTFKNIALINAVCALLFTLVAVTLLFAPTTGKSPTMASSLGNNIDRSDNTEKLHRLAQAATVELNAEHLDAACKLALAGIAIEPIPFSAEGYLAVCHSVVGNVGLQNSNVENADKHFLRAAQIYRRHGDYGDAVSNLVKAAQCSRTRGLLSTARSEVVESVQLLDAHPDHCDVRVAGLLNDEVYKLGLIDNIKVNFPHAWRVLHPLVTGKY